MCQTFQKKISILVPVYNVEKYLPKCIESLSSQTFKDLEIICLNDGSTDNSFVVLKSFAKKNKRVKIINKHNSGYGDTLNRGIALAKGEYIGIVEPDDFVEPDMFENLYLLAKKHDADVVKCNYYEFRNGKNTIKKNYQKNDSDKIINQQELNKILYDGPAIWAGIYKKEFLEKENISFLKTPGASYQDTSFNFKTLVSAKKIVLTDKAYLHYRRDNENSSVKSNKKIYAVNKEYSETEKYLKNKNLWEEYKYIFQAVKFAGYHWNLLRLSGNDLRRYIMNMRDEFKDAKAKQLLKKENFPKNHWLALRVLLLSPQIFTLIFKTYQKNKKAGL